MTDLYGCGDHGCIYGHPGGMGTNGGCGCWRDLTRAAGEDGRKAVRQITLLRRERDQLRAQLAHTQELLRCVERDISGEPYIEHYENNAWFKAKEKVLLGEESE